MEGVAIEEIAQYLLTQGPFAALFIWLLHHTQKRNQEREDQLHATLEQFASRYDIVIDELGEIKERLPPR